MVALAVVTRNVQNATWSIQDGNSNSVTNPIDDGDLSWTERPRAAVPIYNRGTFSHFGKGIDNPMEVSFTAKFVSYAGTSASVATPTIVEALKGTGNASAWVSTTNCGVYTVDLVYTITSPCISSAGDEDETITLADFHANEINFQEGEEFSTLSISGICGATAPTAVRS